MSEPTVVCPNCNTPIRLTDSLAAALLEPERKRFEHQFEHREAEVGRREAELRKQKDAVAAAQASVDEQVAARLAAERATVAAAEARKARDAVADEIHKAREEKSAVEAALKDRDAKLAAAQKNELELRREREQLQQEKENFELDKQRAIDEERAKIREAAQKAAEEQFRFKLLEKDKTLSDMSAKVQEMQRKMEQGSQQLQGEVQELELEATLREKFPRDTIEPVPKGEFGGDVLQRVVSPSGQLCGTILWESKRTKNWSDGWLPKLREDMRSAGADLAIVVSQVRPKSCDSFDLIDGVWVTSFACAVPVGIALRHSLEHISAARSTSEGHKTKAELMYRYLTGPGFRHRVQAIVEKFTDMQQDLERERRTMTKMWAKREEQLRGVIESTAGMYGDLQGIAGKSLQEIEGLEVELIESDETVA